MARCERTSAARRCTVAMTACSRSSGSVCTASAEMGLGHEILAYKEFDDELVTLKELGLSGAVVAAMIERTSVLADQRRADAERQEIRTELAALKKLIEEKKAASGGNASGEVVQTKDGPMDMLASCAKRLAAVKVCEHPDELTDARRDLGGEQAVKIALSLDPELSPTGGAADHSTSSDSDSEARRRWRLRRRAQREDLLELSLRLEELDREPVRPPLSRVVGAVADAYDAPLRHAVLALG
jgi:hypothetical protein